MERKIYKGNDPESGEAKEYFYDYENNEMRLFSKYLPNGVPLGDEEVPERVRLEWERDQTERANEEEKGPVLRRMKNKIPPTMSGTSTSALKKPKLRAPIDPRNCASSSNRFEAAKHSDKGSKSRMSINESPKLLRPQIRAEITSNKQQFKVPHDPQLSTSCSTSSPVKTDINISPDKAGIVITDSPQLLRPLRAELKATQPDIAKELFQRLEIRRKIHAPEQEEEAEHIAKPFEPKKKGAKPSMSFLNKREEHRGRLEKLAGEFVAKLECLKDQRKILLAAQEGEDEVNPVAVKLPINKDRCFEIEKLAEFAASHGVTVLNLDQYICATDKREPIYKRNGQCIFCEAHGKISTERHPTRKDCPYTFCACVDCYVVGKMPVADTPSPGPSNYLSD